MKVNSVCKFWIVTLLKVFNSFRSFVVAFLGSLMHTNKSSANVDI